MHLRDVWRDMVPVAGSHAASRARRAVPDNSVSPNPEARVTSANQRQTLTRGVRPWIGLNLCASLSPKSTEQRLHSCLHTTTTTTTTTTVHSSHPSHTSIMAVSSLHLLRRTVS